MPRFRWRPKFRFGPFYVNTSQGRFTSWGIKLGRYSRNMTRGTSTFDTPGIGSLHWGGKQRPPRQRKPKQARPVAEEYEQRRRRELRANRNLMPAANWLTTLGSLGTVGFLSGAPLWVGAAGAAASAGGAGLMVRHVRRERAIGRRGLSFLPYPGERRASQEWPRPQRQQAAGHGPRCRAKSAATCRCPGRRRRTRTGART